MNQDSGDLIFLKNKYRGRFPMKPALINHYSSPAIHVLVFNRMQSGIYGKMVSYPGFLQRVSSVLFHFIVPQVDKCTQYSTLSITKVFTSTTQFCLPPTVNYLVINCHTLKTFMTDSQKIEISLNDSLIEECWQSFNNSTNSYEIIRINWEFAGVKLHLKILPSATSLRNLPPRERTCWLSFCVLHCRDPAWWMCRSQHLCSNLHSTIKKKQTNKMNQSSIPGLFVGEGGRLFRECWPHPLLYKRTPNAMQDSTLWPSVSFYSPAMQRKHASYYMDVLFGLVFSLLPVKCKTTCHQKLP